MNPASATPPVITDISQLDLNESYTYADYVSWKFSEIVELVRGKIVRKMSAPVSAHQRCSMNFSTALDSFLKKKTCQVFAAPFDVRLVRTTGNGDAQIKTVVQPDLCVICDPTKIDRRGCLGAPDWIIEIASPRPVSYDTKTKYDLYAENGVAEYWVVYPGEQTVSRFVLQNGNYESVGDYYEPGLIPSRTLPDLPLQWADVFDRVE